MVQGNAKGSSFERDMCRRFSLWYTKDAEDDLFWRTSGSGSRATNRAAAGNDLTKYQHGDMTFIRPEGQPLMDYFSFEFKSYAGIDFHGIFHTTSPEKSLISFWAKCVRDAEVSGRVPILITKVNHGKPIVWVPSALVASFCMIEYSMDFSRCCQFAVPAMKVVTKRTYPRRKRGAAKKKSGKGKPKLETYTFIDAQNVIGVGLDEFFAGLPVGQQFVADLAKVGIQQLPVPRRDLAV